ncbi:unnamed protein product [Pleuronectes platessa]|uniref:Uncharacterized protein n=1 Tax=Pleuronectes platessa TaxID=8262 RepID=A0A9N7UDL1_PLEPL|nr:unnamed protein product [Pleuronectes platessa]
MNVVAADKAGGSAAPLSGGGRKEWAHCLDAEPVVLQSRWSARFYHPHPPLFLHPSITHHSGTSHLTLGDTSNTSSRVQNITVTGRQRSLRCHFSCGSGHPGGPLEDP